MLSLPVLYYGQEKPLPAQVELRAGPLELIYEQGDLRYIRQGEVEIVRRIYVAVRDRNWGTVPVVLSDVEMSIGEKSFLIRYHVDNRQNEIDFGWEGELRGDPDGKITFSMEGIARSTFWRNRIGFCVLHPASLAGSSIEVQHIDGEVEQTAFPTNFVVDQPVQPFSDLKCITYDIAPGKRVEIEFKGDVFEMEDQRNWTDASFKTFCTPLCLPYPIEVPQGTKISQSITIRLLENEPASFPSKVLEILDQPPVTVFTIDRSAKALPLPTLGLGMASHEQPLTPTEIELLRRLCLAHLRVDLSLFDPGYKARLRQAAQETQSLGVKLEAALFVSDNADRELADLRTELESLHPAISAWLCYPQKEGYHGGSPIEAVVTACRKHLEGFDLLVPFFAGTNYDLIFLKRNFPSSKISDGFCFSICPQVHAFDNASLVETLEVQGKAVESARGLGMGLPVRISPVTLKMRSNPYATGPAQQLGPDELPPQVDVRQMSLFGAGWTAGSFKYLAEAGAQSVTFYETTGWQGVMETQAGPLLPAIFRSQPGMVFPIYHVLAELAEYNGGKIIPVRSSHPLQATGLLLWRNGAERMLVVNFSPVRKDLKVECAADEVLIRFLDEKIVLTAMRQPEAFRLLPGLKQKPKEGFLLLELQPFAIAVIDVKPEISPLSQ
jgi:hypothetical protein